MQGFNKYFPKDFDPKKHRSVNQHLGVHPLGKRASKLESDGVLVVRFEMPFNIWCGHCAKPIGKGVRYNAQKKAVGKYLSTVIWGFRCKCHLCSGWFEIRTDPKNAEYVCHEGARRKVETYEPEDAGVMKLTSRDEAEATNADPLARLDRDARDAAVAQANREEIERLMDVSDARWGDDFSMNQAMRRKFREEKAVRKANEADSRALAARVGTTLPIGPATAEDLAEARSLVSEGSYSLIILAFARIRLNPFIPLIPLVRAVSALHPSLLTGLARRNTKKKSIRVAIIGNSGPTKGQDLGRACLASKDDTSAHGQIVVNPRSQWRGERRRRRVATDQPNAQSRASAVARRRRIWILVECIYISSGDLRLVLDVQSPPWPLARNAHQRRRISEPGQPNSNVRSTSCTGGGGRSRSNRVERKPQRRARLNRHYPALDPLHGRRRKPATDHPWIRKHARLHCARHIHRPLSVRGARQLAPHFPYRRGNTRVARRGG